MLFRSDANQTVTEYGLRLLRKCAFSLVNQQELSAQQVAAYLTGCEDSFRSHEYENLYWPSFERFVEDLSPSPECYEKSPRDSVNDATRLGADETSPTAHDRVNEGIDNEWSDGASDVSDDLVDLGDTVGPTTEVPEEAGQVSDELTLGISEDGSLVAKANQDRKSTRLNSSHSGESRMPSSA